MTICLTCKKETKNKKFCSNSCAATFNNTLHPRREKQGACSACGKIIKTNRKFCRPCYELKHPLWKKTEEMKNKSKNIRVTARRTALLVKKAGVNQTCVVCGYNKHIEVCHIKPVSEFGADATFSEINALDNLVLLCPNCHWEFDHALIDKTFVSDRCIKLAR